MRDDRSDVYSFDEEVNQTAKKTEARARAQLPTSLALQSLDNEDTDAAQGHGANEHTSASLGFDPRNATRTQLLSLFSGVTHPVPDVGAAGRSNSIIDKGTRATLHRTTPISQKDVAARADVETDDDYVSEDDSSQIEMSEKRSSEARDRNVTAFRNRWGEPIGTEWDLMMGYSGHKSFSSAARNESMDLAVLRQLIFEETLERVGDKLVNGNKFKKGDKTAIVEDVKNAYNLYKRAIDKKKGEIEWRYESPAGMLGAAKVLGMKSNPQDNGYPCPI
jgi:hypothetical protein